MTLLFVLLYFLCIAVLVVSIIVVGKRADKTISDFQDWIAEWEKENKKEKQ